MSGRYVDREPVRPPVGSAVETASERAIRMGLHGEDFARFMCVFATIRAAELNGVDTEAVWRGYNLDPEGHVAVAAYIQGVASTRVPGTAR